MCLALPISLAHSLRVLGFDGTDDIGNPISDASWNDFGSNNFTIEVWIKSKLVQQEVQMWLAFSRKVERPYGCRYQ
ncbi:MAG: hypothetical protein IPG95_05435 [Saprospiraceae bacterium]|nr:hypothetical protein [Saprospiraceae bacterium]